MTLIRIVRMTFKEDKIDDFLKNFEENKHKIRGFRGCSHLELLQDAHKQHIFCTYSHWESEEYLENYRNSELFKRVWENTKILFADKPIAFSVYNLETV